MKNAIKVLWYVVIAAMVLTVFVLVSAKVFAHGDGKCLTDADDDVRLSNDGWVKIIDHLSGDDLDGFAHGHLYEYYDKRGNSTGKAMGFFSIDFDDTDGDYFADCPPIRQSDGETHLVDYFLDRPTTPDTPTTTPDTPTTRHSHNHTNTYNLYAGCSYTIKNLYAGCSYTIKNLYAGCSYTIKNLYAGCSYTIKNLYAGCSYTIKNLYK